MDKKEIVIVTLSLGNDGAERVLTELANEWVLEGNKVSIIQIAPEGYGCSYKISELIEVINIKNKYRTKIGRYIKNIFSLQKELRKRPNAVLLSFLVSSSFILAMCKPFIKNKIVVSERNDPRRCPDGRIRRKMRDFSFFLADVCVFQTEEAKSLFSKTIQRKGHIIVNPINGNLPARYEGERRKAIVTACRLHPQKNLPMLVHAFQMLNSDFPEYILEIYGQGDERENLESLVKSLHLDNKVFMPGFEDDIHKKMVDAEMYVSSSNYEGISNSMLEALGMGVPTICTDCPCGGARMYIKNNTNGLLVPVGDTVALYKAMKRLVDEPDFAKQISEKASEICKEIPIQVIAKKWLELF